MFNEMFGNDPVMNEIMQGMMQMYGALIIYYILMLAFKILFMLAIGFDCKSKANKNQAMWMVLCFFFPLVVGIIYACTENKKCKSASKICPNCGSVLDASYNFCPNCSNMNLAFSESEDSEQKKKTSKTLFGVSVALFVCAVIAYGVCFFSIMSTAFGVIDSTYDYAKSEFDSAVHYGYDINGETVYYDREGNLYYDDDDVLYYDEAGTIYKFDDDDYSFASQTGESYDAWYCYVNKNGYFYFDAQDYHNYPPEITYYDSLEGFRDEEGNTYYYAIDVSWDSEGNLVDNNFGYPFD